MTKLILLKDFLSMYDMPHPHIIINDIPHDFWERTQENYLKPYLNKEVINFWINCQECEIYIYVKE